MKTNHVNKAAPHIHEDVSQIVLHPDDDDLFVQTGKQVIEGCRMHISVQVWLSECREMLDEIRHWIEERSDQINSCYAMPRGNSIAIFFIPRQNTFNFDLADELAELSLDLQRFNVGPVELHQIPEEDIERFVVISHARKVFSHG